MPEGLAHLAKRRHRAGGAMSEREVGTHARVHGVQSPHQHVANEVLRRDLRELLRELEDDQHVDPTGRDQLGLALHGGQQPRLLTRREDLAGMSIEGHRDAPRVPLLRRLRRSGG